MSKPKRGLGNISRLAIMVWRRDFDVYLKTYKTALIPPLLEPILYLFAFGFGLGAIVTSDVEGMSYIQFIAPAMIGLSVMNAASFECTYASYVRMYYQKTFDAIVTTPASVEDIVTGELLWGATKAVINATIMVGIMLVVGPLIGVGLLNPFLAALIPLVALVGGLVFATIAMCFTALVPMIDHFNYFIFLVVTPMMLLCGTFFPLSQLPVPVQSIALALPLTHVVLLTRQLATGTVTAAALGSVAYLLGVATVVFIIALALMRRRLVK